MAAPPPARKIVHVDMDAFFAAVEQRDDPALRGRPVVVGGTPEGRGVVAAASYEARRFGVHSAMPAARARRLCPDAVFVRGDYEKYGRVSREIRAILQSYTDLVEPLSLDEAYLDVTENLRGIRSATELAQAVRREIRETTRLTASAGVGPNKFIAKVASDVEKPDGLCVVPPEAVPAFLKDLPVRRIPGIGRATEERCRRHGIVTCGDLLAHSEERLVRWFGSAGTWFHQLARGIDTRPVTPERDRKSCGIEDTFPQDVLDPDEARSRLASLARQLEHRLRTHDLRGRTVTLKVKYADFRQITRSCTVHDPVWSAPHILAVVDDLLRETDVGRSPVRLLGISVSQLEERRERRQLLLPFYEALLEGDAP